MTTSARVLEVARSQVGVREARDMSTPYHRAYGIAIREPWCAVFTWWCFREAGAAALTHPKTAYTPTLFDWYAARGLTGSAPQVGDLVFYNWRSDRVDRIQHVGLVEAVEQDSIVTIEGNTSAGVAGSQSNGDGVYRRRRARNGDIVGYGHPPYITAPAAPAPKEDPLAALSNDQQVELHRMVVSLHAQLSGDADGAGPDLWGWPSMRHGGGPDLTLVDLARHTDREVNSRLGLVERPGPDVDTLLGHVLSLRAELRALGSDVVGRLANLAQSGGVAAVVAELNPDDLQRIAAAIVSEQGRRFTAAT